MTPDYIAESNTELENVIIGTILMDRNCLDLVFTNLIPEDFTGKNSLIYNSCLRLFTAGRSIDMITILEDMKQNNESHEIKHILYCTNLVASSANIESHIHYLKNQSLKKQLSLVAAKTLQNSIRYDLTAFDILSDISTSIEQIKSRTTLKKPQTFKEVVISTIDEALNNQGSDTLGLKTGFEKFDNILSGFCAPDFTIIAAGPGEGKSTFALNISKHVAMNEADVLFFSLEMSEKQLIWKLLSDELDLPVNHVRRGIFDPGHAMKTQLTKARLHIYDRGGITIDDLCGIVKMELKTKEIKIVFIDYLQLVRVGNFGRKLSNRNDEVTVISNKLKQLAMETSLPIVALSQLNRDKTRKRYGKHDLRDSGALEQDADNIIFIFRPFEHDMTEYALGNELINCDETTAIINIDKCRLGQTGEFQMIFNGACSRFEDLNFVKSKQSSNFIMPKADLIDDLPF